MNELEDYLSKLSERTATQFRTLCDKLGSPEEANILRRLTALKYSVFYSNPYHTLKRGRFYLMGLNPGGREKDLNQYIMTMKRQLVGKEWRQNIPVANGDMMTREHNCRNETVS